ncbi:hypothetical protein ACWEQ8_20820 [Streptomyces noursei]
MSGSYRRKPSSSKKIVRQERKRAREFTKGLNGNPAQDPEYQAERNRVLEEAGWFRHLDAEQRERVWQSVQSSPRRNWKYQALEGLVNAWANWGHGSSARTFPSLNQPHSVIDASNNELVNRQPYQRPKPNPTPSTASLAPSSPPQKVVEQAGADGDVVRTPALQAVAGASTGWGSLTEMVQNVAGAHMSFASLGWLDAWIRSYKSPPGAPPLSFGADAMPVTRHRREAEAVGSGTQTESTVPSADYLGTVDKLLADITVSSQDAQRARQMVDDTLRAALVKYGVDAETARKVDLDALFTACYRKRKWHRHHGSPEQEKGLCKAFTLREVMLGEAERENEITGSGGSWTRFALKPPQGFSQEITKAAVGDSARQWIGDAILEDSLKVIDTPQVKDEYVRFANNSVRGVASRLIEQTPDEGLVEMDALTRYLAGERQPKLVVFNGDAVPNLVALDAGNGKLLLSVATGESFLWSDFVESSAFEQFMREHLSAYESGRAAPERFKAQWHDPMMGIYTPALAFRESDAVYEQLWDAALTKVRRDADALAYTPAEQARDATLRGWRNFWAAMSTLATIVAVATTGGSALALSLVAGGAGIASTRYQWQLGQVVDRGDARLQAENDAALGLLLSVAGTALDVGAAAKVLRTAAPVAKAAAAKNLRAVVRRGQDAILSRRIAVRVGSGVQGRAPLERASEYASVIARNDDLARTAFQNGEVSWDAVIRVDELAGVITAEAALELRSSTRWNSFEALLGGKDMKEVMNVKSLRRIPAGHRVAIFGAADDGPVLLHAMTATKNGKVAGLNNAGLNPKTLKPSYSEFDLVDDAGLRFRNGAWELPDGRQVKVCVSAQAPEFRIEPVRGRVQQSSLGLDEAVTQDESVRGVLNQPTKELVLDNGVLRKMTVAELIRDPAGQCEVLLSPVGSYMGENGFTNIRYRGMGIWSRPTDSEKYVNHFVVLGDKGGSTWVFDLSAGQFAQKISPEFNGPIVTLEANWAAKYQDSMLVKYQDFTTPDAAVGEFSTRNWDPLTYKPGATVLHAPRWFKRAKKTPVPDRTAHVALKTASASKPSVTPVVGGRPAVQQYGNNLDITFGGLANEAVDVLLHPRVRFHIKYLGRLLRYVISPTKGSAVTVETSDGRRKTVQENTTEILDLPAGTKVTLDAFRSYTVRDGDTPRSIAQSELGDEARWPEIYAANKDAIGDEPLVLKQGQVYRIPEDD